MFGFNYFLAPIPCVPVAKKHSTLFWFLYQLFSGVAGVEDCQDAIEFSFLLLLPRHKNLSESSHLRDKEATVLYQFLEKKFREQAERNRKGKEPVRRSSRHFRHFIIGLNAQNVEQFDAGTTIFEQLGSANKNNVNLGIEVKEADNRPTLTKELIETWKQAIDEVLSLARWKFTSSQNQKGNKALFINYLFYK